MSRIAFLPAAYRASRDALLKMSLIALATVAAACGDGGTEPAPTPVVATVVVSPDAHAMFVGDTKGYAARVLDAAGQEITGRTVTWSSSDETVATVSATGLVTALRSGTTFIKATVGTKFGSGALDITLAPVATVTLDQPQITLTEGGTRALVATAKDAAGRELQGRAVAWTSDNATIATVSATGTVTALNAGTTVVRATIEGKVAEAQVAVTAATVDRVELSSAALTIPEGEARTLTAVAKDANGRILGGRAIEWQTSDERIVTVNERGELTAVAEGRADVTASVDGKQATAVVTVSRAAVASVSITPGPVVLEVGEERQLRAIVKDANGRILQGRTIQWTVDATTASISPAGLLVGVRNGYVTISAKSEGVEGAIGGTISDVTPYDWDLLYFRQGANAAQEIFTLTFGSGAIPVKINAGNVSRTPTASPDGNRIAFAVSMKELGTARQIDDIFAVDRDGRNMKQLTTADGWDVSPAYSPNGQRIAYVHGDGAPNGRIDIWVMNADGSGGHKNLTADLPDGASFNSPAWSRDGSRLAFVESRSGVGGTTTTIWSMRVDGADKRQLTSTLSGFDQSPTWSPDGSKIAFARYYTGLQDIAILNVATGVVTQIPRAGGQSTPSWSPDGTLIAFTETVGPSTQLYTMRPDGSQVRRRTLDPAWGGGLTPQWIRKQ